ncbi:MAG: hypothetical protein QM706_11565 [Nitrospira sp.]
MSSILIADPDPRTIDPLPRILSDTLPGISVDICTTVEELRRNRKLSTYDTIAINPSLIQGDHIRKFQIDQHLFAPLLVTASLEDCELATTYLENGAFDLIIKPIVPLQAAQTVRLALWQNSLLRMLGAKDRAAERFRQHMEAFPHARKMEEEFAGKIAAYERTLRALTTSMPHLLDIEQENFLFDIAGVVEGMAKERAFERLHLLCENTTTH